MTTTQWGAVLLAGFLAGMLAAVLRVDNLARLCAWLQSFSRRAGDWGYRNFGALGIALLEARDAYRRHQQRLSELLEDQRGS